LIEAIAAGAVDGGWPSTRAFANAGIIGLEAIEAPMLITSFRRPEGALQRTGRQHGPRAPRRERGRRGSASPCSTCAGRSPSMRRCSNQTTGRDPVPLLHSPVQSDTIRALGAEPVDLSFGWVEEVNAGRLRGAESGVLGGTPPLTAKVLYVTANVVLWPKVAVFCFSQERFDALTEEQRDWVTQAAELATQASVDATYDEDARVQAMLHKVFASSPPTPINSPRYDRLSHR
jgi:hypothetical protein